MRRFLPEVVALTVIASIALVVQGWIAFGGVGIISFSDSADYLFFTDFYRGQFYGEVRPQDLAFYWATRFPPLFPLVLAVFGGGTHDLPHTQMIACSITVAMLVPMWVWLRRESGSALVAATITVLVVASPGLFLLTLNPVSEPLAMGLTWLVFALSRDAERKPGLGLPVALVAGLATLARSINVALVLSVPVWMLMQRPRPRPRHWVGASVVALVPFLAWMSYRRTLPRTTAYTDAFDLDFVVSELGGWPELLYVHPWRLVMALVRNFDTTPDALSIALTLAIGGAAILGALLRLRARKLDAVFLAIYVGILLVWPYPREAPRFVTQVLPIVLLHAWVGLDWLVARATSVGSRAAIASLTALVFGASAGTVFHFVHLATQPLVAELRPEQREPPYFLSPDRQAAEATARRLATIRIAAREAAGAVPDGECVYAVLPYLLERHGQVRTELYPVSLGAAKPVEAQLSECAYLFVVGIPGAWPSQTPFFPMDHLGDSTVTIFTAAVGDGVMVAALLAWKPEYEERRRRHRRAVTIEAR
jgi:hypothetical protein